MTQELHRWAKAQLARAEDAYQTWKDPALLNNQDERVGKLAIYRAAQSLRDVQMWKQVIALMEDKADPFHCRYCGAKKVKDCICGPSPV